MRTLLFMGSLVVALASQAPTVSTLHGSVVGADGVTPIPAAVVSLRSASDGVSRATLTDSKGGFRFERLPIGSYLAVASKPPFVKTAFGSRFPEEAGSVISLASDAETAITIRLLPGAAIEGRVSDNKGAGLQDFQVSARRIRRLGDGTSIAETTTATTDERGQFRVFGLVPGDYIVGAQPPRSSNGGAVSMSTESIDEILSALVRGQRSPLERPTSESRALEQVIGPVYYPDAPSPIDATPVSVDAGQVLQLDLIWRPTKTRMLSGAILGNPDGRRIDVTLEPQSGIAGMTATALGRTTAAQPDGTFRFSSVTPGRYLVTARGLPAGPSASSTVWAEEEVTVSNADLSGVLLSLTSPGAVVGVVTAQVPGLIDFQHQEVRVVLRSTTASAESRSQSEASSVIGVGGVFRINGVKPGLYHFGIVTTPRAGQAEVYLVQARVGQQDALFEDARIDGGSVTQAQLQVSGQITELTGVIQGLTVDDHCTVIVFSDDERFWRATMRRVWLLRPTPSGEFGQKGIPAGNYHVAVLGAVNSLTDLSSATLRKLRTSALLLTIREGERTIQNLQISR